MSSREVRKLIESYSDDVYVARDQPEKLITHLKNCFICYSEDVEAVVCGPCCYNHVCVACGSELRKCPMCRKIWDIIFMIAINDNDVTVERVLKSAPKCATNSESDELPDISDNEEYVEQVEEKLNAEVGERMRFISAFEVLRTATLHGDTLFDNLQISFGRQHMSQYASPWNGLPAYAPPSISAESAVPQPPSSSANFIPSNNSAARERLPPPLGRRIHRRDASMTGANSSTNVRPTPIWTNNPAALTPPPLRLLWCDENLNSRRDASRNASRDASSYEHAIERALNR